MYDIISLSDLVSMWKIQTNSYFQTRQESLVYVHMKEKNKRATIMKEVYVFSRVLSTLKRV